MLYNKGTGDLSLTRASLQYSTRIQALDSFYRSCLVSFTCSSLLSCIYSSNWQRMYSSPLFILTFLLLAMVKRKADAMVQLLWCIAFVLGWTCWRMTPTSSNKIWISKHGTYIIVESTRQSVLICGPTRCHVYKSIALIWRTSINVKRYDTSGPGTSSSKALSIFIGYGEWDVLSLMCMHTDVNAMSTIS